MGAVTSLEDALEDFTSDELLEILRYSHRYQAAEESPVVIKAELSRPYRLYVCVSVLRNKRGDSFFYFHPSQFSQIVYDLYGLRLV